MKSISPGAPIGFIGLGVMGRPMAGWLLKKGWFVHVYSRRPEAAQSLLLDGARGFPSPIALSRTCRVVILCLTDEKAVDEVIFGPNGLVRGLNPGSVIVDTSTIGAGTARVFAKRLEDRGVVYMDAPVSGGEQGAVAGTLACMIGGPASATDLVRNVLDAFTRVVTHVGDVGAGQAVKACNQIAAAGALLGVADAIAYARLQGVDPEVMRQVLLAGTARSFVLEKDGARIIDGNFRPGFRARLMLKDLRLALDDASGRVDLEVATLAVRLLMSLCDGDYADQDWSAVGLLAQRTRID